MSDAPNYAVPALDKALDIIELLAKRNGGLSQMEIARATDRTPGQIFRTLTALERRGYVVRDSQSGLYEISMKLFDLAHRHEPMRTLITAALRVMRPLTQEIEQSCNLGIIDADRVRAVAQVESPADFGFHVRVGALFSMHDTAPGMVLAAFSNPSLGFAEQLPRDLVDKIRLDGYVEHSDPARPSITDISVPILRSDDGTVIAALTAPYVATSYSRSGATAVREATRRAALEIAAILTL